MLLRTSILDSVSADLAAELTDDRAGADALPVLARADAFVRPLGQGWYRYQSLLGAVLRLKLRVESGEQIPDLYRRAARWCQRHGRLGDAVRYAAQSGDWPLAADIVVDEFAIGQIIELRGHQPLAEAFRAMPPDAVWTQPQPLLVMAAIALRQGAHEAAAAQLAAAEDMLGHPEADDQIPARLAAALIQLELARRTGDLEMAATAAQRAEDVMTELPEEVRARHPEVQTQVIADCGVVETWAGRLDAAAVRLADAAAVPATETAYERAGCLGYLALVEALRGRLSRAVELAGEAAEALSSGGDLTEDVIPAASVALAWVCLQQGDAQEAHARLKLAEAALRSRPDKLVSALACVVAAQRRLAGGQAAPATDMIRPGMPGLVAVAACLARAHADRSRVPRPGGSGRCAGGRGHGAARRHGTRRRGGARPRLADRGRSAIRPARPESGGPRIPADRRGAGRGPAQLHGRGRRPRPSLPGARAAAGQAGTGEAALRHGTRLAAASAAARPRAGPSPTVSCSGPAS